VVIIRLGHVSSGSSRLGQVRPCYAWFGMLNQVRPGKDKLG